MHADETADDVALRAIVRGVETETGDRFFPSLVRHLATALGVKYAFVSELTAGGTRFRTRAVWEGDRLGQDFEVPLAGTPCEAVLGGEMAHHPDALQHRFPEDVGLVTWGAESYCGVPLLDASERVVGHLAIIDDRPMPDGPRGLSVMRIFAARARAEIERLDAEAALRASEQRLSGVLASAMDAIVTIDESRRIVLWNAAAEAAFRCDATDAVGRSLDRFLDVPRALVDAGAVDPPPAAGGSTMLTARRASGEAFPVETTISRATVDGRVLHTLILRDLDERRATEEALRRLDRQNEYLQEEIKAAHNVDEIVGGSPALAAVLEQVRLVASTDSSVLILGETGTGKELIARAIHAASARRERPLIKVSCAALPSDLVESELFGHEKGAFTGAIARRVGRFELAHGGTIFLDEIGELSADVQVKLLRVLQEHEFERVGGDATLRSDVRVIAATNRDLVGAVAAGTFRQDLYYRLNVFPVVVPPLRARAGDVPLLVHYLVSRQAAATGRRITRVPSDVMQRLVAYSWPGNVRELENVIERAVILSPGTDLVLPPDTLPAPVPAPAARRGGAALADVERRHVIAVLQQTRWRIDGPRGAARLLGLQPSTLRSRMRKLGVRRGPGARS